jgi:hypothetical protein
MTRRITDDILSRTTSWALAIIPALFSQPRPGALNLMRLHAPVRDFSALIIIALSAGLRGASAQPSRPELRHRRHHHPSSA